VCELSVQMKAGAQLGDDAESDRGQRKVCVIETNVKKSASDVIFEEQFV